MFFHVLLTLIFVSSESTKPRHKANMFFCEKDTSVPKNGGKGHVCFYQKSKRLLCTPNIGFFCWAYFEIDICPFFPNNGHITNGHIYEIWKKWAYANGHIPKYAHLNLLLHIHKNQTLTIRKYEGKSQVFDFFCLWVVIFSQFRQNLVILQMGIFAKNIK